MIIWFIRAVFILVCAGIIMSGTFEVGEPSSIPVAIAAAVALVLIGLSVDLFVRRKSITITLLIYFSTSSPPVEVRMS